MDIRMNLLFSQLQKYCEDHSGMPDEVLYELQRETGQKTLAPQMISGYLQGQFLEFISRLARPKRILEVGTFTAYATICLARGLHPEGKMDTIEVNPELAYLINKYLEKAKLTEKVDLHIGDALTIIPTLPGEFDLVFLDAGKQDYQLYYELLIDRIPGGGLILADNVLWSGKVLTEPHDADTAALHAFNEMVQADQRVDKLMLPLRDGLYIIQKR